MFCSLFLEPATRDCIIFNYLLTTFNQRSIFNFFFSAYGEKRGTHTHDPVYEGIILTRQLPADSISFTMYNDGYGRNMKKSERPIGILSRSLSRRNILLWINYPRVHAQAHREGALDKTFDGEINVWMMNVCNVLQSQKCSRISRWLELAVTDLLRIQSNFFLQTSKFIKANWISTQCSMFAE